MINIYVCAENKCYNCYFENQENLGVKVENYLSGLWTLGSGQARFVLVAVVISYTNADNGHK